jgi:hypothetical protein
VRPSGSTGDIHRGAWQDVQVKLNKRLFIGINSSLELILYFIFRMRIINAAGLASFNVGVDGHMLTVIEVKTVLVLAFSWLDVSLPVFCCLAG